VNASVNRSIAITNENTALIRGSTSYVFNFSTNAFSTLPTPVSPDVIRASADGSHIYGALQDSGSTVYSFDPTTWAVRSGGPSYQFWTDLAVSADGSQFAAVATRFNAAGDYVGFFNTNLQFLNTNVYPGSSPPDDRGVNGAAFSPGGKVVVVPLGDSVEFWDVNTGTLRARLMTPEELVPVSAGDPTAPMMAINGAGDTVYAVSASGLSVIPLPGPMDQMVPVQWPKLKIIGNVVSQHGSAGVKAMMRKLTDH
jgi:WD40 repeat protein